MRVAFLQNYWEDLYGALMIGEVLKREGHDVRFFMAERGWIKKLGNWMPHVVAMSTTSGNHRWYVSAAGNIKKHIPNPPLIIMGWPHPTFFPEVIEHEGIDAICIGEGELAITRLLAETEGDRLPLNIPNFWVKEKDHIHKNDVGLLVEDLDKIPFPRRDILYDFYPFLRNVSLRRTITGRGCPYDCAYCHNHSYRQLVMGKGTYIRRRSVEHVIDELTYLKSKYGFKRLAFMDDLFTYDKQWFLSFAREYRKAVGIPYLCLFSVNHIDADVADALKESGCELAAFGVESANEIMCRTVMNRIQSNEKIIECAQLLHARSLNIQTFNIVGLPGESLDDAVKIIPEVLWGDWSKIYYRL